MANEMIEIMEAIQAGERALISLRKAEEKLNSASNWGLWDLFGGGFISGMVKHNRINEASFHIEDAKHNLILFQEELWDVNEIYNLSIDMGGFLSFADLFCDGVIADCLVQKKISDATRQVQNAIWSVSNILAQLRGRMM